MLNLNKGLLVNFFMVIKVLTILITGLVLQHQVSLVLHPVVFQITHYFIIVLLVVTNKSLDQEFNLD